MKDDNFVLLTALQLSRGTKPKKWQLEFGLKLLIRYINQRKVLGLDVTGLMEEYIEAYKKLKN